MAHPVDSVPQTTQDFAEFKYLLYDVITSIKAQKVFETGTNVGDSTRILSKALEETGGKLVTIDLKPPENNWPESWPLKNIQFAQGDASKLQIKDSIDVLFLDDDHAAEAVKQRLQNLGPAVRVGGKIALHDTCHSEFGPGIFKAVHDFCRENALWYTHYPLGHGMIIIEVSHPLPVKV